MERDHLLRVAAPKRSDGVSILAVWKNSRRRIAERKTEQLKRSRQLEGGVLAVVELGRSRQELGGATTPHIRLENPIWIVEVAEDQIETGEVTRQLHRQVAVSHEKSGERAGFNRATLVCVETFFGQRGNGFRAKYLEMRPGEAIAKQFDGGQRQDKIADGAAANDENPVQFNTASRRRRE
jgi:hypothetical protein